MRGETTPSSLLIGILIFSLILVSFGSLVDSTYTAYGQTGNNLTSYQQITNTTRQIEEIQNTTQSSDIESGNILDLSLSVVRGVYEAILLTFKIPTITTEIASDTADNLQLGDMGSWIIVAINAIIIAIIVFAIISAVMKWRL